MDISFASIARQGALLGAAVLLSTACGMPSPEAEAPRLQDVEIPAGFDFATTRGVTLTLAQPAAGALEVRTESGAILYRGPQLPSLSLNLATKDAALDVTLVNADGARTGHRVPVVDGAAAI